MQKFHSNGKLLLTGEYVVLDGATALAIPTKYGQSLSVKIGEGKGIFWRSYDFNGKIWYEEVISLKSKLTREISIRLQKILFEAKKLNQEFLSQDISFLIETHLDFPRDWGLGTSSTLINNIAQWANVDAFELLKTSFGGSGYDIAAAQNDSPILYALKDGIPQFNKTQLQWDFKDHLFFVHLNHKQDSKEGISRYRNISVDRNAIQLISNISNELLVCNSLSNFERLMTTHEEIISGIIKLPTIKEQLFSDYPNIVKSLGAWGGDFVLVTGDSSNMDYFRKKGFETIVPYSEMIL